MQVAPATAMIERPDTELEWSSGPEATDADGRRRLSRSEQAFVWMFGILDLLLDVGSESRRLARDRIELIRQMTRGETHR